MGDVEDGIKMETACRYNAACHGQGKKNPAILLQRGGGKEGETDEHLKSIRPHLSPTDV